MKILPHRPQLQTAASLWRRAAQALLLALLLLLAATGAHAQSPVDDAGGAGAAAVIPVNICLPDQLPLSGTQARAVNSEPALSYNGDRAAFWSTANPMGSNADGSIEVFTGIIEKPNAAGVFTPTVAQLTESRGNILGGFNIMPDVAYATLAGGSSTFTVFASDRDLAPSATINNADGGFEIFIARRTGNAIAIAQLTNGRGNASILPSMSSLYPEATPRYVNVAFVSDADDKGKGQNAVPVGPAGNSNYELYAMKLDMNVWPPKTVGAVMQVTQTANDVTIDKPAMSSSGNAIVFLSDGKAPLRPASGAAVRDNNREVFRVLLPATFTANAAFTFTQVTNTGIDNGTIIDNDDPDCNADGTRVVFSSTEQSFTNATPNAGKSIVYLSNLTGAAPTYLAVSNALKVSGNPAFTAKEPALSGVGDRVVFAADACAVANRPDCAQHTGEFQVFVAERDAATGAVLVAQVTSELTATHEAPAISGDGRFVALVKSEGNAAVNPDLSGSEVAILYCPDARLEPIKTVDNKGQSLVNDRPDVGDVVDYVVSFKNGGLATFEETMAFVDTLPDQVAFVGFAPDTLPDGVLISPYDYDSEEHTVSWTLSNVPFGQLATVRIQAQVLRTYGDANELVAGATIANRVFMTPTTSIPDITTGKLKITHDTAAEMTVTRVDLSAGVRLSTQTPREGEAVNVTFTMTNVAVSAANPLGALDPATNVVLTTTLPSLSKYSLQVNPGAPISGTWAVSGNIGTWTVPRIDASKKATLSLRLTPRAGFGGTAADSFAIGAPRSDQQDDNSANNIVGGATRLLRIVGTDLQLVSKEVDERRPPQNSYVTYSIVVRNNGPLGVTPGSDPYNSNPNAFRPSVIVVQDPLPTGVVFKAASAGATQTPPVGQGGVVTWEIPNLALGASRTLTVTAQVLANPGVGVVNTVNSLQGYILPDKSIAMPDPTAANNGPVSAAFTTNTPVAVGLTINPEPDAPREGEKVTLTARFTDTDSLDDHTITVTWGDGQTEPVRVNDVDASGGITETFTHVYADDDADDSFTISVTVSDGRQSTTKSADVNVRNVLPASTGLTVTASAGYTGTGESAIPVVLLNGAPLGIRQTFSDPGFSVAQTITQTVAFTESFSYRIDWGDGVISAPVTVPPANVVNGKANVATVGGFDATHAYTALGTFTVRVYVSDDDGSDYPATPTASLTVIVARVPLAVDDRNNTVDEDSAVAIAVLANDSADTPVITAVNTAGTVGDVTYDAGSVTYTATGRFDALKQGAQATDRFGYSLTDRFGFIASAAVTVTVTGVNDLPVLDLNGAAAGVTTTVGFTEDAGAVVVAPATLLTDPDDTVMNSASVQIQNALDGSDEVLQVTPVAPITAAYNPATGVLTLAGEAPIAAYRTTLARVAYLNNNQNPNTTPRVLVFNVRDQQGGNAAPVNATVTVARTDDPPVVTTTAGETTIVEGPAATRIDPGVTVIDVDNSDNFAGGGLAVTVQAGVKWDELSIVPGNNVSVSGADVSYNGTPIGTFTGGGTNQIIVNFNGNANAAIAQAVAQQVAYTRRNGPKPESATKVVTFVVRSSATGAPSNTASKTVRLTAVNDPPVITFATFPTVLEEAATNIRSSFTVTDVDTTTSMSMTVRVNNGTLNFTSPGLTATGNGTNQITVQGTNTQLNAAAVLNYTGNANFSGLETITVAVNDNDTGPGPLRVSLSTTFNVTNVNDAPTLGVADVTGVFEDQPASIAALITLGDVDAQPTDTAWLTATVSSNGRLTVALPLPADVTQTGSGSSQVVLRGTLAALNAWKATANALVYQGIANYFGSETLTVRFSDGASAAPVNLAATPVVKNFTVAAVNDAPSLTLAQVPNADETAPVSVGGLIAFADVDTIAGNTAVLTATVLHGALTVSPATPAGLTVSANPAAQVVVRGTFAAINTWKAQSNALVYRATANYLGSDTLTVGFNDGSTVAPTNLAAEDAASTFTVGAINDPPVITLQPITVDEDVVTNIHPFIAVADPDSLSTTMRMTITVQFGTLTYTGSPPAGSGTGTNRLVLDGTLAQLNNANPINYQGPPNVFGSSTITVIVNDGDSAPPGPRTATAVGAITINAVNDAPVLDLNGPSIADTGVSATFTEGAGAIVLAPGAITISDVENNNIVAATIELTNRLDGTGGAAETLTAVGASGITVGAYNATTGQLLLTGPASPAAPASYTAWQNVLKSVRYNNTSANPSTTPRIINFRVGDNGSPAQASQAAVATVSIVAVNNQPLLTVAATASVNEDAPLSVGGLIAIADADPQAAETATFTATVLHGTLTVSPAAPAGLAVSGSGTAQVVAAGSLANINAWLAGTNALVYQGVLDYNGADSLVVNYRDGSGAANQAAAPKTTAITVAPVADAPTLASASPGMMTTVAVAPTTNITPTVTNAMLTASDVDSDATSVVYTLIAQPAVGTLLRDGVALDACGVFTQADIDNNLVSLAVLWEGADIDSAFAFNVANEADCAGPGTVFTIGVTASP